MSYDPSSLVPPTITSTHSVHRQNISLNYEPNIKRIDGYTAFIDFATADEAIRATSELDARQDAGELLPTRKPKQKRKIHLLIQGETAKMRKRRRRGTLDQQGQESHSGIEEIEKISEQKPRRKEVIVISEPEPEESNRHHKEDPQQIEHYNKDQHEKPKDAKPILTSSFIRISDLPFETTEAEIRDFLGGLETYVASKPSLIHSIAIPSK